jgi:hypothetical protein
MGVISHNFASRWADIYFLKIAYLGNKIANINHALHKCSCTKYLMFNFKPFFMNIQYDVACISVNNSLICIPNLFPI